MGRRDRSVPPTTTVLASLADTPKQIARLSRGCTEGQLNRKPAPDAWSAQEIVAHLRACAEVWGRSIERMLTEEHPTIRYVSPRGWIKKTNFLEQRFGDSLHAFSVERKALLAKLRKLETSDWERGATFSGTTLGRNGTVLGYAARIADHEAGHLDQIRRTLAAE
jgi:hypothetical protein